VVVVGARLAARSTLCHILMVTLQFASRCSAVSGWLRHSTHATLCGILFNSKRTMVLHFPSAASHVKMRHFRGASLRHIVLMNPNLCNPSNCMEYAEVAVYCPSEDHFQVIESLTPCCSCTFWRRSWIVKNWDKAAAGRSRLKWRSHFPSCSAWATVRPRRVQQRYRSGA
jgi:hypothetical protein